jgi:hypothetical protein
VKEKRKKEPEAIFARKEEAVRKAREEAKEDNASLTIQKRDGRVEKRTSYNPNRKAPRQ